ncbi:hypothetical protein [Clostridium tertium]|jgi:hypothetical protein|uniref:hypothetical protein n=1 Tax=Clostridium tertium TaxID=1559 RepID=UPI001C1DDC71|nr:hypothetical protein [Clostridium tertium]MBU6135198.1 hypothetical protein [Clostridium tertium]
MRLTKQVRQKILEQNEGFSITTYYSDRNSSNQRTYTIINGELHIRDVGKTSWADSRYDEERIADDDEVHRFLYGYKLKMNLDGIE